jgi:N-methylhydantoinase A
MERAIRRISVERGHDPRAFTLVPFGGAGPLHACDLAAALGIPRVLVPVTPGVLSALGMLVAAPTRDYSRTLIRPVPDDGAHDQALLDAFAPLEDRARREMAAEGHALTALQLRRALDMRYVGQSHELTVALAPDDSGPLADRFHAAHEQRYGYRQAAGVEVVTLRLVAEAPVTPPSLPELQPGPPKPAAALLGHRPVWFAGRTYATALYDRDRLRAEQRFAGPAVVVQYDTTTVIPPDWHAAVDRFGNLSIERR